MEKPICKFFKLILLSVVSLLLFAQKGFCETGYELNSSTKSDSLSDEESWNEETFYRIGVLRLQRWVNQNPDVLKDSFVAEQLPQLLNEAKTAAQNEDYYMANLWLDSIWELFKPSEVAKEATLTTSAIEESFETSSFGGQSSFKWSNELIAGVDLWRQEFRLKILEEDSTFIESNGNPFSGVRFSLDYNSINGSALNGHTFFKYSRDYLSGEAYFDYHRVWTPAFKWRIKNRFEGTSFYGDFTLKYLQNLSSLALTLDLKPFALEVGDDFQVRNYADSDSIYASYTHNALNLTGRFNWGYSSFLSLRYRNVLRQHREIDINDYAENSMLLSLSQRFGSVFNFNFDNEIRFRDYRNVPADYFLQDYWENYLTGDVELKLTDLLGLKFDGSLTKRRYDFVNENSLPDVLNWDLEPGLEFTLTDSWKIGAGFHYGMETYEKLISQVGRNSDPATDAISSVYSIQFEDFYEYGPVVTLEVFKINSVMLSVRQAFLFRRYSESTLTNSGLAASTLANTNSYSLYSDRNNNSLLIFLTWTLSPQWQITALANLDDDRSLEDESGDSQNTLLDFEVSFSF